MQVLRQTPTLVCIIGLLCTIMSVILISCGKQGVPIHVVEVSPQGEVNRNTNITIYFSGDVVSPDTVDILLDQAPVAIDPAIPGRFKWIDNRTLRFLPTERLSPSTAYKVDIHPSIVHFPGYYFQGKRQDKKDPEGRRGPEGPSNPLVR